MATTTITIGATARVQFAFVDEDHALETPTAISIVVRSPDYPTTADVTVTEATPAVTLAKALPLADRKKLARQFPADVGVDAADLVAGTGVVEYLHVPDTAGLWQYTATASAPTISADTAYVRVRAAFT